LHDLLPNSRDVGTAMAFVVVGGNIFGMIAPIGTGYVIGATGSYDWAFGMAGILMLVGATVVVTMARSPMNINRDASSAQVAV
jgi:ACS family glucarate transporter-like MFS transporter